MTARPVFGDFAEAASTQFEDAMGPARPVARRKLAAARAEQVQDFSRGLAGVLDVMGRYTADITRLFDDLPAQQRRARYGEWAWACFQAREAILNATTFVSWARKGTGRSAGRRAHSQAATRLDAAAFSLTVGRDLLQTHFTAGPQGARLERSEWAQVVTSRPVTRALLFELAQWARTIALQGGRLALSGAPIQRGTGQERRQLNAACQWLWAIDSAVQGAHVAEPLVKGNALGKRGIHRNIERIAARVPLRWGVNLVGIRRPIRGGRERVRAKRCPDGWYEVGALFNHQAPDK